MILVTVEYDPNLVKGDEIIEVRDYAESIIAGVFQLSQNFVDMRMRPYGDFDEREAPIFFIVDTSVDHGIKNNMLFQDLKAALQSHLDQYFGLDDYRFRLWLRIMPGLFSD